MRRSIALVALLCGMLQPPAGAAQAMFLDRAERVGNVGSARPLPDELLPEDCSREPALRSVDGNTAAVVEFVNRGPGAVRTYWLNYQGERVLYQSLAPGQAFTQPTYLTHPWVLVDAEGRCLGIYLPASTPSSVIIAN